MSHKKSVKEKVYEYVCEHPGATEEEMAAILKVHVIDVLNALVLLEREGRVKSEEILKSEIL